MGSDQGRGIGSRPGSRGNDHPPPRRRPFPPPLVRPAASRIVRHSASVGKESGRPGRHHEPRRARRSEVAPTGRAQAVSPGQVAPSPDAQHAVSRCRSTSARQIPKNAVSVRARTGMYSATTPSVTSTLHWWVRWMRVSISSHPGIAPVDGPLGTFVGAPVSAFGLAFALVSAHLSRNESRAGVLRGDKAAQHQRRGTLLDRSRRRVRRPNERRCTRCLWSLRSKLPSILLSLCTSRSFRAEHRSTTHWR